MEAMGPVIATVLSPRAAALVPAARTAFAAGADRVEIRIDGLEGEDWPGPIESLSGAVPLLVAGDRGRVRDREIAVFRRAQSLGAWVDLPFARDLPEDLWGLDRRRIVLSYHDFEGTPPNLEEPLTAMRRHGTAVFKIVPTALDLCDQLRLREFLRRHGGRGDLCCFAMGAPGTASRVLALAWGSCATYASAPGCDAAAPGQMALGDLLDLYHPREARGEDPLYGVIGWPLLSTGSPALHNRWLRALGLPGRFVPLPVRDIEASFRLLRDLPLHGVAVTVPHKRTVLGLLERTSRLVREVGACNTLLPSDSGWIGANTDLFGIRCALSEVPRGTPALLLGAGGAAAAAARVLSSRGPLAISARDRERAAGLAGRFGACVVAWEERASFPCGLLVNATPCGQTGEDTPYPPGAIGGRFVFDMVVREGVTPLLRAARERGAGAIPGQVMLEAQARLQFRLFTGSRAPSKPGG
jgi:3-dehydroquinate dehydratase / shikimate dehydrogenase